MDRIVDMITVPTPRSCSGRTSRWDDNNDDVAGGSDKERSFPVNPFLVQTWVHSVHCSCTFLNN